MVRIRNWITNRSFISIVGTTGMKMSILTGSTIIRIAAIKGTDVYYFVSYLKLRFIVVLLKVSAFLEYVLQLPEKFSQYLP